MCTATTRHRNPFWCHVWLQAPRTRRGFIPGGYLWALIRRYERMSGRAVRTATIARKLMGE
jgi:hypothetical protein